MHRRKILKSIGMATGLGAIPAQATTVEAAPSKLKESKATVTELQFQADELGNTEDLPLVSACRRFPQYIPSPIGSSDKFYFGQSNRYGLNPEGLNSILVGQTGITSGGTKRITTGYLPTEGGLSGQSTVIQGARLPDLEVQSNSTKGFEATLGDNRLSVEQGGEYEENLKIRLESKPDSLASREVTLQMHINHHPNADCVSHPNNIILPEEGQWKQFVQRDPDTSVGSSNHSKSEFNLDNREIVIKEHPNGFEITTGGDD